MRCIYLKLLVWPEKNRLWKAGWKGQTAPSSALTAAYHKEFTTERGGIVFSSWIDEKRVVLFNGPTLDVSEQTEGNPSPPDYRSRRAGEWSRPRPPSLPPSSVVRMIFSCLWPEGFTLTPEPLQFLPGSKWPQQQKMQRVPLKLKSLTHQIQTLHQHHQLHPSQTVSVCCDWEQVGSLSAALSL